MPPRRLPALALLGLAACAPSPVEPRVAAGARLESLTVTSAAFTAGGAIPVDHSCDGKDELPELVVSAAPAAARSLVVVVDDPDAPGATFTHLLAYDLPPETRRITTETLAASGARLGANDFAAVRYSGPCPPRGEEHRYRFRLVALDRVLGLREGAARAELDAAMDGHVLAVGTLVGRFGH